MPPLIKKARREAGATQVLWTGIFAPPRGVGVVVGGGGSGRGRGSGSMGEREEECAERQRDELAVLGAM